jgi:hypothetical protein
VSCSSPTTCLAVGDYTNGNDIFVLAEAWNGTSWTIATVPLPGGSSYGNLLGVTCPSVTACTAVGYYVDGANTNLALAEAWNGTSFASQPVPTPAGATTSMLRAVSCGPSPSIHCEAVGFNYAGGGVVAITLAERWNGTTWSVQHTPAPTNSAGGSYPTGVSCSSSDACTSVGEAFSGSGDSSPGWAQLWNGTRWTNQKTHNPTGADSSVLSAVSCTSTTSHVCTAVGDYSNGSAFLSFAERWNGKKWIVQKTPEPKGSTAGGLNGVSCSSSTACTAVGYVTNSSDVSTTLEDGWNGTKWSTDKTLNGSRV